ncbi:phospholipase D-like protein [Neolewinella xylanilytica]|uniref:Phospholipase D-like protein n=2 Tax=Neolewinella xylanilytica TaxID=1514080 RepID=A0A2S6HZW5_9BACT|nr:phospholipase D-like protein [Neolewinella xylanilytica]
MITTFISQGYDEVSENAVGKLIVSNIESGEYDKITILSAFASRSAIQVLQGLLLKNKFDTNNVRIIVGIDQGGTTKQALLQLLTIDNAKVFLYYQKETIIFHPKIYLFEGINQAELIVGSSNLTLNGLFRNVESSIRINGSLKDMDQILNSVKAYYHTIFDESDSNLVPLSPDVIHDLTEDGKIPTESSILRPRNNKKGKNSNRTDKLFSRKEIAKIPRSLFKYFKNEISKSNKNDDNKNIQTLTNLIDRPVEVFNYDEPSYHFPQGVHVGHILYGLKVIGKSNRKDSHIADEYVRLRGDIGTGEIGGFQRKSKYLLIGMMQLGLIDDNRNVEDQSNYQINLTENGRKLFAILEDVIELVDLSFKKKNKDFDKSWEMVHNKRHYIKILKSVIQLHNENLQFFRNLIFEMGAVNLMAEFLNTSDESSLPKTQFIYEHFFSFPKVVEYCKKYNIKPGTVEAAKRRCPLIIDLLEIAGLVEQSTSYVDVGKLQSNLF